MWGEEPHTLDPLTTWTRLITLRQNPCFTWPLRLLTPAGLLLPGPESETPLKPFFCSVPSPGRVASEPVGSRLRTCRLSPPLPSEHVSYGPGLTFPPATGPLHLLPPLPETLSLQRAPSLDPSFPAVSPPRAP